MTPVSLSLHPVFGACDRFSYRTVRASRLQPIYDASRLVADEYAMSWHLLSFLEKNRLLPQEGLRFLPSFAFPPQGWHLWRRRGLI